jgi:putative flavoprotein involved in K+ transport
VKTNDCVVVGAGQAGLGVSYFLQRDHREHVVLEQGRIGESWLSQRWDSFKLNTPNFMSVLPGPPYDGPEPDGFLRRDELVHYLQRYTDRFRLPVRTGVSVISVEQTDDKERFIVTARPEGKQVESIVSRTVVIACGSQRTTKSPPIRFRIPVKVAQLHTADYRPVRSWLSEAANQAARSPKSCWLPAARCTCARAGSAVFPAATGDATCWSGGWT